jgi:hypothetical protein
MADVRSSSVNPGMLLSLSLRDPIAVCGGGGSGLVLTIACWCGQRQRASLLSNVDGLLPHAR